MTQIIESLIYQRNLVQGDRVIAMKMQTVPISALMIESVQKNVGTAVLTLSGAGAATLLETLAKVYGAARAGEQVAFEVENLKVTSVTGDQVGIILANPGAGFFMDVGLAQYFLTTLSILVGDAMGAFRVTAANQEAA